MILEVRCTPSPNVRRYLFYSSLMALFVIGMITFISILTAPHGSREDAMDLNGHHIHRLHHSNDTTDGTFYFLVSEGTPIPVASVNGVNITAGIHRRSAAVHVKHRGENTHPSNLSLNSSSCPKDHFRCNVSNTCHMLDRRCDGMVDCPNAEDEVDCACAFRLSPLKFCDKYPDCFDQSDESFCSYCPRGFFNCGNGKCVPTTKTCDMRSDCDNMMDENFCFRLEPSLHLTPANMSSSMSSSVQGYLLRNLKGQWHPVCANPYDAVEDSLSSHACTSITSNPLAASVYDHRQFTSLPDNFNGEYVYHYHGRFIKWNGCFTEKGIFVTCDDLLCGFNPKLLLPRPHQPRIVGGNPSEPGAWPWHAAVYKNGTYACGATLVNNRWLVSAAHCFYKYTNHYYEAQLGMLRRRSFTPHQKVYRISHIIIHSKFSLITLEYDIALLRTSIPVSFDFWIRPICLPYVGKMEDSEAICTAIGWGDTGEDADGSDDLQEVHIPLTKSCRKSERWLCAGFPEGGHDACQGDSGGPLMCLRDDGMTWYLAGVISAGTGCARPRTPGMYTRISFFLDWMKNAMVSTLPRETPLELCPGLECSAVGGGRCLKVNKVCDGHVDCYDTKDEINCKKRRN